MWGASAIKYAGADVLRLLDDKYKTSIVTALDYGCGQEAMKKEFPQTKWTGYDPGIPGKTEKPEGQFDLVVCVDVMEHIEPQFIETVLEEIADYAKIAAYLDIACTTSHDEFRSGPWAGQEVHISQYPADWWEEKVRALQNMHVQETTYLGRQLRGEWRTRCKFLLEKL